MTQSNAAFQPSSIQRRGLMLVLSSPSGAGKTTITRRLVELDKHINLSISATTRPKRDGETNGTDYNFVDTATFSRMIERSELLEHAKVFGNYYGTPRGPVETALASGRDVLFDIDWQGTQQLAEKARDDLVSVFILPPSYKDLEKRLQSRGREDGHEIAKRMAKASEEMSHWSEYDYVIVNTEFEHSVQSVWAILCSERLRRRRQMGLADFVKGVQQGR